MASAPANRVQMTVTGTPGTGTITLNAATSGYQSFATAYGANATVNILIVDGTNWEIDTGCTYTNSGTTVTRGTRESSSSGGAVSFTSAAIVSVVEVASWGAAVTDATLNGAEISITTTATATISRQHVCSGTSANYTVTLPAAASCTGLHIAFRMSSALTKLVTIKGNASELIDGSNTRIMWANETCTLYCDGTGWTRMSGKTIPMVAIAAPSTNQTITLTSGSMISNLNTSVLDNTGLMVDTTNNKVVIQRPGVYNVSPTGRLSNANGSINRFYAGAWLTRSAVLTQWFVLMEVYAGNTAYSIASVVSPQTLQAADSFQLAVGHDSTNSQTLNGTGDTGATFLAFTEVPQW